MIKSQVNKLEKEAEILRHAIYWRMAIFVESVFKRLDFWCRVDQSCDHRTLPLLGRSEAQLLVKCGERGRHQVQINLHG